MCRAHFVQLHGTQTENADGNALLSARIVPLESG